MFAWLTPDLMAPASVAISPLWLYSRGFRALILDIDNTLAPYEDAVPDKAVLNWFAQLSSFGIQVAFVSNNNEDRIRLFNGQLGYLAFPHAKKPLRYGMERAIEALGVKKEQICVIGDQLFTDILAAKRCGLFSILVPPIRDKRDPFTRFKRLCERPFLKAYHKNKAKRPVTKLAVLGSPIAHSLSPLLHQTLAQLCDVPVQYDVFSTNEQELPARIAELKAKGYHGFNCTMPLKTAMSTLTLHNSESAQRLHSVNTVLPYGDGFYGDSTDGAGILQSLVHHGIHCAGKRVVLLGAGGAARSIADALLIAGASLSVFNRTEKIFDGILARKMTPQALCVACADCDILIQATSCGMEGCADFEDLSFLQALPAHAVVVDAVYHPIETSLLRAAQARGCKTIDGLWMLLYQGVLAFAHFTGVLPDREMAQIAHDRLVLQVQTKAQPLKQTE